MTRVLVLDRDTLAVSGLIDESFNTLTYTRRFLAAGQVELVMSRQRLYADTLQKGALLWLPDEDEVFLIEVVEASRAGTGADDLLTVKGRTIDGFALGERIIIPPTGEAYDEDTGPAESVIKHYVDSQAVDAEDTDRNIPGLSIAADAATGTSVVAAGRFQYVLDLLASIGALAGMGWEVKLVPGVGLVFDTLTGIDRSGEVFFDFEFEALSEIDEIDSDLDTKTVAYVAGQGEGVSRDLVERGTATGWDRREGFVDARDVELGNTGLLEARGDSALAAAAPEPMTDATINPAGSFRYREHWDLGDLVLIRDRERAISYTARVVEVTVVYNGPGGVPDIRAVVGRPFPTVTDRTGNLSATADSGGASIAGLPAGGVLSGTYPDPGFAVDMATQAELNAVESAAVMDGDAAGGDLSGTYPNPSVQNDSHSHTSATAPGVADTAGPDANITIDGAGAAGTSGTRARSGHGHRLDTYSSTPAAATLAGSAGTSATAPARGNHSHPHAGPVRRVYTSGATWTKPAGLSHIEVECLGPGGAGGGAPSTGSGQASTGGGGGAGGYARKLFLAAALPSSCTVTVGTGGTAGSAGNDGNAGSAATTFAGSGITTVSGGAGNGGRAGSATSGNNISVAGTGGTSSGGDINASGGNGIRGVAISGGRGSMPKGADSMFGQGGQGNSNTDGGPATGYGAGGGGGTNAQSQSANQGGAGAGGLCIVTEYYF